MIGNVGRKKMDEQMQKIADQVKGKIHWGATRTEVFEWLQNDKRLSEEDAERLIECGFTARRQEVRQRALVRVVFAGIGVCLFGLFLYLQYLGEFILIGIPVLIVWGLGLTAVGVVGHSLYEVVTGDSDRPM